MELLPQFIVIEARKLIFTTGGIRNQYFTINYHVNVLFVL